MKILIFLLIDLIISIPSFINDYLNYQNDVLGIFETDINNSTESEIMNHLEDFLKKYFQNFKEMDLNREKAFKNCANLLLQKTNNIYNYLYLLSYSGKEFSDLGLQPECVNRGFSYYLLSFFYNITNLEDNKIYEFLEQRKFYIGLCVFNECEDLIKYLFNTNFTFLNTLYHGKIIKIYGEKNNDDKSYLGKPYYTLNRYGDFDEKLSKREKTKYTIFFILFIIAITFLSIEIIVGIIFNCGYNLYHNISKSLSTELNIENENENEKDDEDEEGFEEVGNDKNDKIFLLNNRSSEKEQKDTFYQKLISVVVKYFSLFTNIIILTIKKNKYYNNKNMKTISKLRILSLLLITFSTNFDVLIRISPKVYYDDSFYKQIYFAFFKFASFGIDMFICLDGFEVMYKLMTYYKKNYFDKGNKSINFKGILKFYLYSLYRIFSFIILFFIVNYFNRYYIYMHNGDNGEALYFFYSNNVINKKNVFEILNPIYTLGSYFSPGDKNIDDFIFDTKMSLLFINEFYIFTIFIIIFYIGNILKSKIYDYSLLCYMFISYVFTYLICLYSHNDEYKLYTYKKLTRNILLIKYPHMLFNHYLIGAFTGLMCFYSKDLNTKNALTNEKDKCPFIFCLNLTELFEFLIQKGRKIWIFFGICIEAMICSTYTILLFFNKKKHHNENISLDFILSLKFIYYYESGLFIFIFCFITILLFAKEKNPKISGNYNILTLLNRISFSYANTVYLMTYSYYCLFTFELKLTYQNLWFITFGIFFFFCLENLVLTIIFVVPFKIIFKTLLDKYIILNKSSLHLDEMRYKGINDADINGINNYNNEEDDSD